MIHNVMTLFGSCAGRKRRQWPFCDAKRVIKRGFDEKEPARQRHECKNCSKRFDGLTFTIVAGHKENLEAVFSAYRINPEWF